jgi:subtilisin family serine protease
MCRSVTKWCLLIMLFASSKATAAQYAFQVAFTDKSNTSFSLSAPLSYLSPRAIARRAAQGIAIDSTDLPVSAAYIDSVLTLTGGTIHSVSRWLNVCVVLLSDSTQIHALDGKPFIKQKKLVAFYSGILHLSATASPKQSNNAQKPTSLDAAYYGNTWMQTAMVNGHTLHSNAHSGAGKLIAVIDAGFIGTDTHPGFDSMHNGGRLVDWHNFTLASSAVYGFDMHGTKVLSTMAGLVPGTYVGSAPYASYAIYVTEDNNSEQPIELYNMLGATERADSIGADVINTSLGYNTFDNAADNFVFATDFDGKTTVAAQAANMATQKGMLFVASAGNEGGNSWNMILTPGDADSALTIGSVDGTGVNAPNSGYGPNAAGQVKPDVCALGQPANIFTVPGYGAESGTSFATPQIAGWAACLWQVRPSASPYALRQAIIKCASKYTTPGAQIGYGIPDFACTQLMLGVENIPSPYVDKWVMVTPNPFSNQLAISVSLPEAQFVDLSLMDVAGRVVFHTRQQFSQGNNIPYSVSLPGLPAGIYLLKAISASQQQVLRVQKM